MFNIEYNDSVQMVYMAGQLDVSQTSECQEVLENINTSFTVDMSGLDFICSAGIGVLVMTYSRLKDMGENVILSNLSDNISNVFKISLLDTVFDIE